MPRQRSSRSSQASNANEEQPQGRSVAAHVRSRQRAVAEREAARLARPEQRRVQKLAHADRKKSAVSSTPFGIHRSTNISDVGEWCGPFSVARQIIAQREEARRKQEEEEKEEQNAYQHPLDDLMHQVDLEKKRKAHPSMTWKSDIDQSSTPTSIYAKRQKRVDLRAKSASAVPSLFRLCLNFLVDHFEYVESVGDVDNDIRVAVSKELVKRNQFDAKAFRALVSSDMECLEIVDCAGIPQDAMSKALLDLTELRYLILTHAGRCFGPRSVKSLLETKAPLSCLSIAGAYLLKDEDVSSLIKANDSTLQSLAFDTCPLLASKFVEAIQGLSERNTLLELSLKNLNLSKESLRLLSTAKASLKSVRSLTLKSMPGLTDSILIDILQSIGDSLETLDISHNYELTDACLSGIRQFNPRLRSLTLNGVKEVTALGLETFFTYDLEGLPPPPKLKVLNLASCDHQAVTDQVLKLATASSSTNTSNSLASTNGGLAQLDIQGSSLVTDIMLEQLVETSTFTLTDLNVSYCPLLTDNGLGYFVSKTGEQLTKVHVWGCAQLSDDFFDGHARANDRNFEIVGAWMRKSGTRSLR